MLRYLTAGESHGPGLVAVLEGMPAGVEVSLDELKQEQARRRWCYGRGGRASIEKDEIQITGGVYKSRTTGAPIGVFIPNKDYANWAGRDVPITAPRPGHADLPGAIKYGFDDCRPVAERASARETAARVACGYFAKKLLGQAQVEVLSWVASVGEVVADLGAAGQRMSDPSLARSLASAAASSDVRCPDAVAAARMMQAIDRARDAGDTLGGTFEVVALNVPLGLGSHVHWDRRLDARLAAALMSINAVKAVEIGAGCELARMPGSLAQDPILPGDAARGQVFARKSNMAGGIEGGISNGEPVFARAVVKPVPTLPSPLPSVDLRTGQACPAHIERSDVCVIGSAAVVAEAMVALVLADAWIERFGGDVVGVESGEWWCRK